MRTHICTFRRPSIASDQLLTAILVVTLALCCRTLLSAQTAKSTGSSAAATMHIQVDVVQAVVPPGDRDRDRDRGKHEGREADTVTYNIPLRPPRLSVTEETSVVRAEQGQPAILKTITVVTE